MIHFASSVNLIPICPEQLGGLSTPRPSANIVGGDGDDVLSGRAHVINEDGKDVTDAYKSGAKESLRLARLMGTGIALLRERSPSCGLFTPYCESKTGFGMGVTAALLHSCGIRVFGVLPEEDFPSSDFLEFLNRGLQSQRGRSTQEEGIAYRNMLGV
jgi:uncharacterized protein YbbK (DUF523 family)